MADWVLKQELATAIVSCQHWGSQHAYPVLD